MIGTLEDIAMVFHLILMYLGDGVGGERQTHRYFPLSA